MKELMIVANVAIVFGVVYKLFELFVGRKERILLIEKLGDKLTPDTFKNGIIYRPSLSSFGGLRMGCLLLGLGIGLLAGFGIANWQDADYTTSSVIYGACVLIGGGLGLIVSYLFEMNQLKKEK